MSTERTIGRGVAVMVVLALIVALIFVFGAVGAVHAAQHGVHMTPVIPMGLGRYA